MLGIIGKKHLIKIMMMLILIYLYMAGILKHRGYANILKHAIKMIITIITSNT